MQNIDDKSGIVSHKVPTWKSKGHTRGIEENVKKEIWLPQYRQSGIFCELNICDMKRTTSLPPPPKKKKPNPPHPHPNSKQQQMTKKQLHKNKTLKDIGHTHTHTQQKPTSNNDDSKCKT